MESGLVDIVTIQGMSRGSLRQRKLDQTTSRNGRQFISVKESQDHPVLAPAGTLEGSEHLLLVATNQLQVTCLHARELRLNANRGLGLV